MNRKTIPEHQLKRLEYLSTYLKELRINEGISQHELCENLHRNTIVRVENAKNITLISLFNIADELQINIKELFMDIE